MGTIIRRVTFKPGVWMEVQAPGYRYYHSLAKMDEMFSENKIRYYVDMPWMAKPYFYSSDIRGLHRVRLSPFQKRFYAKLYRLRIVEQKRFVIGGAKYTEDLKRFHQLQDEYLLLVNNDIKDVVGLVKFQSELQEKMQRIDDRQQEIYKENSSRKRKIKTNEQYREYQMWHVEVQSELNELKQEKRNVKRQLQLVEGVMKEDLYTAYYAVSEDDESVGDREVGIPKMEEMTVAEKDVAVVPNENATVMNYVNGQNENSEQQEHNYDIEEQKITLCGDRMSDSYIGIAEIDNSKTNETGKMENVEASESELVDKVDWIVRKISELGGYENLYDSVKVNIFEFDIANVSGSIRLFSDVMKRLGIKLDGDGLYEEFQRIYDESVSRAVDKKKTEYKMWNRSRGR